MGGPAGQAQTERSLTQVYWLGGSPCAGKTTIAAIIAQEHGWQVYHLDRYIDSYLQRADPDQHPHITRYKHTGLKQFLALPYQEQFQRVLGLSMEYIHFVLADIDDMPDDVPILVEGSNLRLQDVVRYLPDVHHALWMTPTEDFLFRTYPKRGTWVQDVLRHYYPEEQRHDIFAQWMLRDARHAQWASEQAREHDIRLIVVDGKHPIRHNAALVEQHFGLVNV